jgi:hypothetical protein
VGARKVDGARRVAVFDQPGLSEVEVAAAADREGSSAGWLFVLSVPGWAVCWVGQSVGVQCLTSMPAARLLGSSTDEQCA